MTLDILKRNITDMETKYASPERSSDQEILQSNMSFANTSYLNEVFCSLSYIFCILNENRQIVFTNDVLLNKIGVDKPTEILGMRFGEAINCLYASDEEAGCGTSEHCRYCGAVNTMLACQKNETKTTGECRVRTVLEGVDNFLDIEVTATPFTHENKKYMIFSLIDISDKKRRAIIEKIFFHDVMNVAGGLKGFFDIFDLMNEEERKKYIQMGASLSQQIIDEIGAHRLITQAENQELVVDMKRMNSLEFIHNIAADLQFLDVAKDRKIVTDKNSVNIEFESDSVLLRRILNNMVKNALEASTPGETVSIAAQIHNEQLRFSVHNPKFMPREIEMQVFMRSFSTKGKQRGLGTYSMKILGEKMLGGKVGFTTSETEGTTFYIIL